MSVSPQFFRVLGPSLFFVASALSFGARAESALIFIDPGHTLSTPGSLGTCGTHEVWVNDAVALRLGERLTAAGFRVGYTRTPNTDPKKIAPTDGRETPTALRARADRANAAGADLFISIHHDSVADEVLQVDPAACAGRGIAEPKVVSAEFLARPDIQVGFNTFYRTKRVQSEASLRLARLVGEEFLALGEKPANFHRVDVEPDCGSCVARDPARGVVSRDLGVLDRPRMPAILVEVTNLRIEKMEHNANDPAYRDAVAGALVKAVQKFFQGNHRTGAAK